MSDGFRLSLVVPTYNRAQLLVETLRSVFSQTVPCFEVVVVDDGSTDETPEVVRRWDGRLIYLRQDNRGVAAARNYGLRIASGNWVTFLDSDDLWSADKVAADRAAWTRVPHAQVLYGGKRILRGDRLGGPRVPEPPEDCLESLALENFLSVGAVTARRECWLDVGGFEEDPSLGPSADWDLWVRLAARYPFVSTKTAALFVREHPDNMMHDPLRMEAAMARAVGHFLADPVAGPKLEPIASRVRAHSMLFAAIGFYGHGDIQAARGRLRAAWNGDPGILLHPLWSYTLLRCLLGRRLSAFLRSAKRTISGLLGTRHEVVH